MFGRGPSKSRTRRLPPNKLSQQARERRKELEGTHVGENDLQTIPTHSIPSGHSTVGGDASLSTSIARPLHLRNYRPNRAAKRAEKRAEKAGGLPQTSQKVRSTNKANRLMPDPEKNEPAFPLHFDEYFRVTGSNAERFGQYVGQKSRQYMNFPLYKNWGPDHEHSFDKFFLQAQKDYKFLPVDPYCPLNLPAIHRGVKIKMQERVDPYCPLNLPAIHRGVKIKMQERAEAKRNKDNRESKKRGRATYTGGSRSMVRAKERVRARIEESGGSSSALKEYLGTHATLVDPAADTFSCTYPDTQTQEYCVSVMLLTN
ncbi:uncharacterized protein A4U43_UnF3520 [Asparagus officinalis]|uniref:Uncharacterized protein n=1 Tax=Asparagus officinalis TaxID=4686 RepID=A0A1R3L728_ASPOF|nr:uncharacterized protein A4U43_UnF3520 [Asparagus officinalis]